MPRRIPPVTRSITTLCILLPIASCAAIAWMLGLDWKLLLQIETLILLAFIVAKDYEDE